MSESAKTKPSIEELLRRVREKQAGAWEELLRRSEPALKKWAAQRLGDTSPAGTRRSDLAQETAMRAFQRFSSFKGRSEERWFGWLKRLLGRRFVDIYREAYSQKRDEGATQPMDESDTQQRAAAQRSPSQVASHQEQWRQLLRHFNQLPKAQSEALTLYYLEDLSLAEIAQHMGKSQTAVDSLIQRGVRTIRDRMSDRPDGVEPEAVPDAIVQNAADAALLVYMRKRQQGEQVDVDTFTAGYPQCAEELRSLLHWMEALYALKSTISK